MNEFKDIVWSPSSYAKAAIVMQLAGEEMLNRLAWTTVQPKIIVEMGARIESVSEKLQAQYQEARVMSLNKDFNIARFLKENNNVNIPVDDHSVDIIFANFYLSWQVNFSTLLREWRRILHPDGLLMFTALGPDTLKEYRGVVNNEDIPQFMDMHDLGDLLLQEGFVEPVLEVDHYVLTYQDSKKLQTELLLTGMWFPQDDAAHLPFQQEEGQEAIEVTYEVIFAHSFAAKDPDVSDEAPGRTTISLASLREQLPRKKGN